jgi:hypothetical protein
MGTLCHGESLFGMAETSSRFPTDRPDTVAEGTTVRRVGPNARAYVATAGIFRSPIEEVVELLQDHRGCVRSTIGPKYSANSTVIGIQAKGV